MVGCLAFAWMLAQRASFGTQKTFSARYSSGSSGSAPSRFLRDELRVHVLERVGDVLEEDQAEHDVLVLGRVHVVAELVRGLPQRALESQESPPFAAGRSVVERVRFAGDGVEVLAAGGFAVGSLSSRPRIRATIGALSRPASSSPSLRHNSLSLSRGMSARPGPRIDLPRGGFYVDHRAAGTSIGNLKLELIDHGADESAVSCSTICRFVGIQRSPLAPVAFMMMV